ncbi:MAG: RHS repeat-associated core domain-containing protein [Verrucomicrobiaceae bacterium]|nr:RHS repeat-associated core domain-containing protein [Verrucomicrobiaceae bacterium]
MTLVARADENAQSVSEDWYAYDSNGNVILLTDEAAKPTARYQYDAFGKTLTATGTAAESNTYRFSTKPIETGSGLAFYGFRYYSPELGRWTARDPMSDESFQKRLNIRGQTALLEQVPVYRFTGNAPTIEHDVLGLVTEEELEEYGLAYASCEEVSRTKICKVDVCLYYCSCPWGYTMQFMSHAQTQPCNWPKPVVMCVRYDVVVTAVIAALLLPEIVAGGALAGAGACACAP